MGKKIVIVVVAVAVIVAIGYVVMGPGKRLGRPKVKDSSKYWVMLATFGEYRCPHCGKHVKLTEEQRRLPKPPPDFACPHCKQAVDVVELMAPKKKEKTK